MKNSSVHVITPATTYVLIDLVTSGWAPAGALNPDAMPCVTVAGRAAAQALATCPASPDPARRGAAAAPGGHRSAADQDLLALTPLASLLRGFVTDMET